MSNVESGGEFDQFCRTLATSTWQLAVLLVVVGGGIIAKEGVNSRK